MNQENIFGPAEGLIQGATYLRNTGFYNKYDKLKFIGLDKSRTIYDQPLYVFISDEEIGSYGSYWEQYGKILNVKPRNIYLRVDKQVTTILTLYCHPYDPNQEPEDDCL